MARLGLLLGAAVLSAVSALAGEKILNMNPVTGVVVPGANGWNVYAVGTALERFDSVTGQWVELLRADGTRAVLTPYNCWDVPSRAQAVGYRARPQVYDAGPKKDTARPISCTAPEPELAAVGCPTVVVAPTGYTGTCGSLTISVVDPSPSNSWRGPQAPVLRP